MFFGKPLCNPDDGDGIEAGSVSHKLAEMGVVSSFKLVFDKHVVVVCGIEAKDICPERAYTFFLALDFEFDANGFIRRKEAKEQEGLFAVER